MYESLVKRIREQKNNNKKNEENSSFEWCDYCDQINLWTYWQGRGCYNPKILSGGTGFWKYSFLQIWLLR